MTLSSGHLVPGSVKINAISLYLLHQCFKSTFNPFLAKPRQEGLVSKYSPNNANSMVDICYAFVERKAFENGLANTPENCKP